MLPDLFDSPEDLAKALVENTGRFGSDLILLIPIQVIIVGAERDCQEYLVMAAMKSKQIMGEHSFGTFGFFGVGHLVNGPGEAAESAFRGELVQAQVAYAASLAGLAHQQEGGGSWLSVEQSESGIGVRRAQSVAAAQVVAFLRRFILAGHIATGENTQIELVEVVRQQDGIVAGVFEDGKYFLRKIVLLADDVHRKQDLAIGEALHFSGGEERGSSAVYRSRGKIAGPAKRVGVARGGEDAKRLLGMMPGVAGHAAVEGVSQHATRTGVHFEGSEEFAFGGVCKPVFQALPDGPGFGQGAGGSFEEWNSEAVFRELQRFGIELGRGLGHLRTADNQEKQTEGVHLHIFIPIYCHYFPQKTVHPHLHLSGGEKRILQQLVRPSGSFCRSQAQPDPAGTVLPWQRPAQKLRRGKWTVCVCWVCEVWGDFGG